MTDTRLFVRSSETDRLKYLAIKESGRLFSIASSFFSFLFCCNSGICNFLLYVSFYHPYNRIKVSKGFTVADGAQRAEEPVTSAILR